jgi:hypothetical protein
MMKFCGLALVLMFLATGESAAAYDVDKLPFWNKPLENDGHVFDLVIYPYDSGSAGSYKMCTRVCSADEAGRLPVVIETRAPGEFSGMKGNRKVHVKARFDAECFKPGAVCTDVFVIFHEI